MAWVIAGFVMWASALWMLLHALRSLKLSLAAWNKATEARAEALALVTKARCMHEDNVAFLQEFTP